MKITIPHVLKAGALASMMAFSGCAYVSALFQKEGGTKVVPQYTGLTDKTVAIVVYVDAANTSEYPQTRKEIATFVASALRQALPKIKLLDPDQVIAWQSQTGGADSMPEKEIGRHFGVDRVLYIEVQDYGSREPNAGDLLRGRILSTCKVFECETAGSNPVWREPINIYWPENGPMDATHGSDQVVRQHVLESFSATLAGAFYEHRDVDKSTRERMEK